MAPNAASGFRLARYTSVGRSGDAASTSRATSATMSEGSTLRRSMVNTGSCRSALSGMRVTSGVGGGREGPPSSHASIGELRPRPIAAGRLRRNERVRCFSLVDPADPPAATGEPAREELGRRRLPRAGEPLDEISRLTRSARARRRAPWAGRRAARSAAGSRRGLCRPRRRRPSRALRSRRAARRRPRCRGSSRGRR